MFIIRLNQSFCVSKIDIQEFYEAILLDENKDANSKALAVLRIADKWLENSPLPTAQAVTSHSQKNHNNNSKYNNGLMVEVGGVGGGSGASGTSPFSKKSPSFHSNKSENMSVDGGGITNGNGQMGNNSINNMSPNELPTNLPSYDDHWIYDQIILERV